MKLARLAATALLTATAAATLTAAPALASTAPLAPAAVKTCAAYRAWLAHPTTVRLNAMMNASEAAPWKYVGEDATGLYSDVRSQAKAKYIAADKKYFTEDCAG
jgi:hypothetical protein